MAQTTLKVGPGWASPDYNTLALAEAYVAGRTQVEYDGDGGYILDCSGEVGPALFDDTVPTGSAANPLTITSSRRDATISTHVAKLNVDYGILSWVDYCTIEYLRLPMDADNDDLRCIYCNLSYGDHQTVQHNIIDITLNDDDNDEQHSSGIRMEMEENTAGAVGRTCSVIGNRVTGNNVNLGYSYGILIYCRNALAGAPRDMDHTITATVSNNSVYQLDSNMLSQGIAFLAFTTASGADTGDRDAHIIATVKNNWSTMTSPANCYYTQEYIHPDSGPGSDASVTYTASNNYHNGDSDPGTGTKISTTSAVPEVRAFDGRPNRSGNCDYGSGATGVLTAATLDVYGRPKKYAALDCIGPVWSAPSAAAAAIMMGG